VPHIERILESAAPDETKEARAFAAVYAAGSASAALRILSAQGLEVRDRLIELVEGLRPAAAFRMAEEIFKNVTAVAKSKVLEDQREGARFYLDMLARIYRDEIVVRSGAGDLPLFNADRRARLEAMAQRTGLNGAAQSAGWILEARANVDRNANVRLAIEDSLCRVAQLAVQA
jgi:hypothetical protein